MQSYATKLTILLHTSMAARTLSDSAQKGWQVGSNPRPDQIFQEGPPLCIKFLTSPLFKSIHFMIFEYITSMPMHSYATSLTNPSHTSMAAPTPSDSAQNYSPTFWQLSCWCATK
jgi:hypothetical protein